MNCENRLRKQVTSEMKKRRLVFLTIVFLSVLYLVISFTFGEAGFLKYRGLLSKRSQLSREMQEIESRNARLRSELKLLREDPFYLEKYAREDFGMAKPDEYVFRYER